MNKRGKIVAVTGGIGSGKSVVCKILMANGYLVYDCDSRAKWLMDHSQEIKRGLCKSIHVEAVKDGRIDRELLSSIVFSDAGKLQALNSIVHGAVRSDIAAWVKSHFGEAALFIETAILYQSGLDRMVDEVWEVAAPEQVRVERVMKRNQMGEAEVRARIKSQEFIPENPHPRIRVIDNGGKASLLLQIAELLAEI